MTIDPLWLLLGFAVVWLIPCKYDPAIRIKEWQIKQGWHPESKRRRP